MKALYFDGKTLLLKELPVPEPGPGEALIRVKVAGVCGTDLEILKGYMGFTGVPGHEFSGVVEKAEEKSWEGKKVVGEINLPCYRCAYCREGLTRHCPDRAVLGIAGKHGAFAQYLTLPLANLHELPENLSHETAVFAEPVAAAWEILEQVSLQGKRVAILGDGRMGLIIARVLAGRGASELVLFGKHESKMKLAQAAGVPAFPAEEARQRAEDPVTRYDLVVEATGRQEGVELALSLVRPRGIVVQKTTVAGRVPFDISRLVVDEVTMIGSRCGPFPPAIKDLASGRVQVHDLVSGVFTLDQAEAAFQRARDKDAVKVLFRISD